MNAGELVELFRSEMVILALDLLRDDELYRYADEGYRQFVRLTGGIPDMTSDLTQIDVYADEAEVELDKRILRVLKVTKESDGADLELINYTDLPRLRSSDYGSQRPVSLKTKGPLKFFMIGANNRTARLINIPEQNDVLQLIVERLPLNAITGAKSEFVDIAEFHQPALLNWLKAKVYQRPGTSFFDLNMSAAFEQKFVSYCNEARRDQEKLRTKVRVVHYQS